MAGSITPYQTAAGKRWRVRYRKPDKSQTDKRGFKTKREAEVYLASVTVSKATGEYIDPAMGRVTVADLYPTWLAGKQGLKPSTYRDLPIAWKVHVQPVWGGREIAKILPSEVQAWVTGMTQKTPTRKASSASVALRALGVLAGILDMAVADRRIPSNPARKLTNLPRKPKRKKKRVYLTHDQLHRLAAEALYSDLVIVLGYTGIRWGEATALRVRHVNQLRRRLHIEENAVNVAGVIHVGTPKSHEQRTVPYPSFVTKAITRAAAGKGPDGLLFGDGTTYLLTPKFGTGWLENAIARLQATDPSFPRLTAHDLRHTAASLAISAGANVKAVQCMLGHASAAHTLDVYSDLFDDDLDAVAERLERAAREQSVGKTWAKTVA